MTGRSGEFEGIARHFAPLAAGFPGALGLLDDAALIGPEVGGRLVLTTDALVAGVHFVGDEPPDLIARKALRVNLSDLAAMGAEPVGYTLALVLPRATDDAWLAGFAAGLAADQAEFGVHLVGGDTVATPGPLTLSITALGRLSGAPITRAGARAGDRIWVSGTIGDGALGLDVVRGTAVGLLDAMGEVFLAHRYRLPQPRCRLGPKLVGAVSAGMDISDGLVADLGHIAAASGVDATLQLDRLPLSEPAAQLVSAVPERLDRVLGGGDDYELLVTAPPENDAMVRAAGRAAGVAMTIVGEIAAGSGRVRVLDRDGRDVTPAAGGYRHF